MEDWEGRPLEGADNETTDEAADSGARPESAADLGAATPAALPEVPEPRMEPTPDPGPAGPYSFRPSDIDSAWPAPVQEPAARVLSPAAPARDASDPATAAVPGVGSAAHSAPTAMGRVAEELVAWFKTLVSAAVYATLIVTFGFQVARVEGESMAPTLENQDRLIVNKLEYRLADPQVGDIVMLYYPLDPDKSFVKRVVAEAGDSIRSVAGQVFRNDVLVPDDFIPEEYKSKDTWGPRTVPPGYYFVMGDHRSNSSDSRTWDYVPKKYIIGKVQLRWWPVDHARWF